MRTGLEPRPAGMNRDLRPSLHTESHDDVYLLPQTLLSRRPRPADSRSRPQHGAQPAARGAGPQAGVPGEGRAATLAHVRLAASGALSRKPQGRLRGCLAPGGPEGGGAGAPWDADRSCRSGAREALPRPPRPAGTRLTARLQAAATLSKGLGGDFIK